MARADGVFADLRAASRFLAEAGDLPAAFDLIGSVREYAMRSMRYEVFAWADHISASGLAERAADDPGYPLLLAVRGYGAWVRGEFDNAMALAHRSQAAERRLGLPPSGLAQRVLANVLSTIGQIDGGLAHMQEQLAAAEESGNGSRLAHACYMGSVGFASTGAYDDARRLADRAGEWPQQWHTLARCVIALDRIDEPAWALEVVGAIESRAAIGTPPVMVTLRDLALQARTDLVERLGPDRSAELLRSGAQRPVADIINRTRQALLGRPPDPDPPPTTTGC